MKTGSPNGMRWKQGFQPHSGEFPRFAPPAMEPQARPSTSLEEMRRGLLLRAQQEAARRTAPTAPETTTSDIGRSPTSATETSQNVRRGRVRGPGDLPTAGRAATPWENDPIIQPSANGQSAPWANDPIIGGMEAEDTDLAVPAQRVRDARGSPNAAGGMSAAVANGALLGFGDEYLAGLSAIAGLQPDGHGGANWFQYDLPLRERYQAALGAIRREMDTFEDERPGLSLGSEVAGAIFMPGAASTRAAGAMAGRVGPIAQSTILGAGAGATYGFGEGEGGFESRALNAAQGGATGALGGAVLGGLGEGFRRTLGALRGRPDAAPVLPGVDALRASADELYETARRQGGVVSAEQMQNHAQRVQNELRQEGFNADLHPRLAAAVRSIAAETGDTSLADMEILRRIVGNSAQSLQPDERRLASHVIDILDETIEALPAGGALQDAREVWARMRRVEVIEGAIERAGLTDDFARGLRTQFRALLRNPRRLRGFSPEEIAAIRRVASGTMPEQGLRILGRYLSPTGISGAALTGGAALGGAGLSSLAIPATGELSKRIAQAITARSAERARQTVAANPQVRAALAEMIRRPAIASPAIPALGPALGSVGEGPMR